MNPRSKRIVRIMELLAGLLILLGVDFTPVAGLVDYRMIQLSSSGYAHAFSVAFSPDGGWIAVGSSAGIFFYNAQTLQQQSFISTQSVVRSLAFSPDGSILATGSYDPTVRLWRVRDGKLMRELKGHNAWVRSISYSPDGAILATASDDDTVTLWDVPSGDPTLMLRDGTTGVRAVVFSPDGAIMATAGYDRSIRLWRVADGTLLRELTGHTDWIRTLAFSPDGTMLASGAFDATVRLWRVADGVLLATRTEHSSSVLGLDFSPDGSLLASSSVDSSVRLWQVPDLTPYDLLTGHSDFVYSVAFAPDGKTLASGSADNTVRVWDVPLQASETAQERISTPTNCKVCHHPRTNALPPRVIEPGCATCHQDGALVRSWCPALDREPGDTTTQVSYDSQILEGSFPHIGPDFGVVISSPGNGEHFYAPREIHSLVNIEGLVFSKAIPVSDIEVQLAIWSGEQQVTVLSARPGLDGKFSFTANIRPEGGEPFPHLDGHQFVCLNCHKSGLTILPSGEVRLVVTATLGNGMQATDERMIYVDHSTNLSIPVNVMFGNGQPVPDVSIQASARLYEWRGRTFTALTDVNGKATLQVEVLSEIPTNYEILLPPMVKDGILYESMAPVAVNLSPGAVSQLPITVIARSAMGSLSGKMIPPSAGTLGISAIHIPDGAVFHARSSVQGAFTFPELPFGRYVITPDQEDLAAEGLVARPQTVDLTPNAAVPIELKLTRPSGARLQGGVYQAGGQSLPFAFITVDDTETSRSVAPDSGRFSITDLRTDPFTLIVSAPGFYSQAHIINSDDAGPFELALVERPESRHLPWGSGQIIVPLETSLTAQELHLSLEQGWLWGSSGGGEETMQITLEESAIEIKSGSFALERIPGQPTWFYVFEGQAELRPKDGPEAVSLTKGQMVILTKGIQPVPVPYDSAVISALHPDRVSPLGLVWEQSLNAQMRDRLARIGISAAQFLTLLSYLISSLILLAIPTLIVSRILKNKRKSRLN